MIKDSLLVVIMVCCCVVAISSPADLERGAGGTRPLYSAKNLLKLHIKWPKIGEAPLLC